MNELVIVKTTFMHMKNYTYVIYSADKQCVIIDPSWARDKYDSILHEHSLTLRAVLLTHHHTDHVNLADSLARSYNCPVYMSESEVNFYNFVCTNLRPIPAAVKTLDVPGIIIQVINTPGHTFGGTCYWIDNNLFTGDTLFIEGCGMCNIDGGDPVKMYESLQKLKQLIPDNTLIYPGHQYKFRIGQNFEYVKKINIYLNFKSCEDFVRFRMRSGQRGLLNFT